MNLFVGVLLAVLVVVLSPAIAFFFGEPRLIGILCVFSMMFVVTAAGQQFRVLAEKDLQFSLLAKIEVAATLTGLVVATGLALAGSGVYALAIGTLTTSGVVSASCWTIWGRRRKPQWILRLGDIKKFIIFGVHVVGSNFVGAVGAQGDVFVFARAFSSDILGLYSQPRELNLRFISVINPIITRVGLPLIAANQHDKALVGRIYKNTILMATSFAMPVYLAVALMSDDLVVVLLGVNWADSSEFLRATAISCAVRAIGNPISSLLNGMGRAREGFVLSSIVTLLVFIFAISGAKLFGPIGIPYGLALLNTALVPFFWGFFIRRVAGLGFWEYHLQILRPAFSSCVAVAVAWGVLQFCDGVLLRLLVGGGAFGLGYVACSLVVNKSWALSLLELVLDHRSKK